MTSICIITARGGSKRVPRKNIKEFCGKSIIAYSIEAALASGVFDTVMVSTDDDEIAEVSRGCGAEVPFMRSEAASSDYATTADVLCEVLDEYQRRGASFDTICCLYPTAPFVRASELREAASILDGGASSVIPVTSFDFPPLRGFKVGEDGSVGYAFPEYAQARSQDLPEMVHDCGRFYFANTEAFKRSGSFITERTRALRIPSKYVQDIDTLEDWEIAEQKYLSMIQED
ncbi:pseudaminic acid cytidylyltransferase [Collinsella sp.]|jgi:pseudaminic acid cytidylyltransferase|uniref:pseudaminic acid cytidylyltransferase n=1 Tax=Collinsella sp. TaxID=1965294 RepID=UPI003990AA85